MSGDELSDEDRLGRLEGIQRHLQTLGSQGYSFLHMPNVFDADPVAEPPVVLSGSFIPEEIGGNIRIIETNDKGTRHEPIATENLEQMLSSYLPGGYKKRWQGFALWQGNWEPVPNQPGYADIAPMFTIDERRGLDTILNSEYEGYTGRQLPTDEVTVYIPRAMFVRRLPYDTTYTWSVDYGSIFANSTPPGQNLELGQSDPTTNYLWFRHYADEPTTERTEVSDSAVVDGYRFEEESEFFRCYYASLLTLYEQHENRTLSRTIEYLHGGASDDGNASDDGDSEVATEGEASTHDDDVADGEGESDRSTAEDVPRHAFVGAREQSQLLLFDLHRPRVRSQVARVFDQHEAIRRDTQFALLYREAWEELFFDRGIIDHVYAVDPFVDHLLAADFWVRDREDFDASSVFELATDELADVLQTLLEESDEIGGRLPTMGYAPAADSDVLEYVTDHADLVDGLLDRCNDRETLLDFGEIVLVHSVEHALSSWAAETTPGGGSFEHWYDVNFQERDDDIAPVGVFDSIQGGAGIATEVYEYLEETADPALDTGFARQGACHTAASDQAVIELLDGASGEVLYDQYERRQSSGSEEGFRARLSEACQRVLAPNADNYIVNDVQSQAEQRIDSLFETRETARFYAFVADRLAELDAELQRTPRAVDLLLDLNRELITDTRVRQTYRRYASNQGRRDLSELGERLEAITVGCITACPDCLQTDYNNCVHSGQYQSELLSRRLLQEVCAYDT